MLGSAASWLDGKIQEAASSSGLDHVVRDITGGLSTIVKREAERLDKACMNEVSFACGWDGIGPFSCFSQDLDERVSPKELAEFAEQVYSDYEDDQCWTIPVLAGVLGKKENFLAAKIYTSRKGYKCMAIMGTTNGWQVIQDGLLAFPRTSAALIQVIKTVCKQAKKKKVTHITGHSLGGYMAECVAAHGGFDGASFAGPGGRGGASLKVDDPSDRQFEVHLSIGDPVSQHNDKLHIAKPKWHDAGDGVNPFERHSVKRLRRSL
mmetsp:Transcript_58595/g.128654  ORF Transcript_58595/g.128654 Transcript_58595/m.128654 type:complete len:264 (+) Transcript_58595:2-793(+)